MKQVKLIFAFLGIIALNACAQTTKVPSVVENNFKQKFPSAKSISWDMEKKGEWEAEFKMNKKSYSANYSTNGDWKETEYAIDESEIPSKVKTVLDTEFKGYDIEGAEVSETPEATVYEFSLEKGDNDYEVAIDKAGKIIKKEKKSEENDEGDEKDGDGEKG